MPMGQLMPMKKVLTSLLSLLVFVVYKHAMLQVHSWFFDMATKHCDGRDKRPRQDPRCEIMHAQCHDAMHLLTSTCVWLLGHRLEAVGLVSIARLVTREGPERPTKDPMSPPDAIKFVLFP